MYGFIDGYDFGEIFVRTPRGLVKMVISWCEKLDLPI